MSEAKICEVAELLGVTEPTLRGRICTNEPLKELLEQRVEGAFKRQYVIDVEEFRLRYYKIIESKVRHREHSKQLSLHRYVPSWTRSAVICYHNNCKCEGCENWEIACSRADRIKGKPPMITAVATILKQRGEPYKQQEDD